MKIKCAHCGSEMVLKGETRLKKTYACPEKSCTHQIDVDTDLLLALKMGTITDANVHLLPYAKGMDESQK